MRATSCIIGAKIGFWGRKVTCVQEAVKLGSVHSHWAACLDLEVGEDSDCATFHFIDEISFVFDRVTIRILSSLIEFV